MRTTNENFVYLNKQTDSNNNEQKINNLKNQTKLKKKTLFR